jgi:adenine-specific DNA-methyltransferase
MPTLHWVGKDKVKHHHRDVPYRVLNTDYGYQAPADAPTNSLDNRIIRGDNLEALKSLLPEFEGKVKCIYIDPPYNTGNEEWRYNDNVNDPRIKKWLGQVVGKEGEDMSRHDKWLCMMYPRLKLLHRLLADDGIVFTSIDDDEAHTLRCIMDEIFGRGRRLATFVWRTDGNFDNQAKIKNCHEYVYLYCKEPELFQHPSVIDPSVSGDSKLFLPIIRNTIVKNGPKNPEAAVAIPPGFPADFAAGVIPQRMDFWPRIYDDCYVSNGKVENEVTFSSGWSSLNLLNKFISNNYQSVLDTKNQETKFVLTVNGTIESVKLRNKPSHVITTLSGLGSTQNASTMLAEINVKCEYPKPVDLITYLISMLDDKNALVLDSFAGSGTTAHAVLKLNAQDGGNRRFILIEMLDDAETLTAERVRRVMSGYGEGSKSVAGLGGGFRFQSLGAPLFDEFQYLNPAVGLAAIRDYVAYQEGIPVEACTPPESARHPYWLGEANGQRVFFCYEPARVTALDLDLLAELVQSPGPTLIYADQLALGEDFMRRHKLRFKKIPRDITRL